MADPRLHEKLDAFRVGHDDGNLEDLQDAAQALKGDEQLSSAFQRSQAFDRAVQDALEEAPVPEGLEEQLLRLAGLSDEQTAVKPASPVAGAEGAEGTRRSAIAWWLAGAAALAATMLALVLLQPPKTQPPTGSEIARQVNQRAPQWTDESLVWNRDAAPTTHPLDPAVKMDAATWMTTNLLGDPDAVVFRRRLRQGNVYLVIAKGEANAVGSTPPLPPQWDTGSRRIGVWSSLGNVYVLVVEGDIDAYKQMIREPYAA